MMINDQPRLLVDDPRCVAILAGQQQVLARVHFVLEHEEVRSGYSQLALVNCYSVTGADGPLWPAETRLYVLRQSRHSRDFRAKYFFAETMEELTSVLSDRSFRDHIIRRHIEGNPQPELELQALREDQDHRYTGPRELRDPAKWSVFVFSRVKQGIYKLNKERSEHIHELDRERGEDEPNLERLFTVAVARRALGTNSSTVLKPGRQRGGEVEIRCRWSRTWVHPLHNSRWPPAYAPSDPPNDSPPPPQCSVFVEIETRNLANGVPIEVSVHHAPPLNDERGTPPLRAEKSNLVGKIDQLFVKHGRVRRFPDGYDEDDKNGDPVEVVFDKWDALWRSWKYPYFYFRVTVFAGEEALNCYSPFAHWDDDYRNDCLQLVGWHVVIGDSGLPTSINDCVELEAPMTKVGDGPLLHRALRCGAYLDRHATPAVEWGSYVRNTYSAVQVGHGRLFLRTPRESALKWPNPKQQYALNLPGPIDTSISASQRNRLISEDAEARNIDHSAINYETWTPPPEDIDNYKSLLALGEQPTEVFGDRHTIIDADVILDAVSIPSVPRYLMIIACCRSAGAPDLAQAFRARGTRWVIGFRSAVQDADARAATIAFYESWKELDYSPEREAIIECFDSNFLNRPAMKAVLFGAEEWVDIEGDGDIQLQMEINNYFARWEPPPAPPKKPGGFFLTMPEKVDE